MVRLAYDSTCRIGYRNWHGRFGIDSVACAADCPGILYVSPGDSNSPSHSGAGYRGDPGPLSARPARIADSHAPGSPGDSTATCRGRPSSRISQHLALPASKIYGVATFYNQFRFQPQGRFHMQVCRGTACHVKGSAAILEAVKRELKIDAGPDHPRRPVQPGSGGLHRRLRPGPGDLRQRRVPRRRDHQDGRARSSTPIAERRSRMTTKLLETHAAPRLRRRSPRTRNSCPGCCEADGPQDDAVRQQRQRPRGRTAARSPGASGDLRRRRHLRPGRRRQETLDAIRAYLDSHEIKADVVKVGCIGLCSAEPMVDVQLPGRTRVAFQQITDGQGRRPAGRGLRRPRFPTSWSSASIATRRCSPGPTCRSSTSIRSSPRRPAGCWPTAA